MVAAAAIGMALPAGADPLLANGGFEEGDFTGWNLVDDSFFTEVQCPPLPSNLVAEGFCAASLGATFNDGTLTQTFATVPARHYVLSFRFLWDGNTPADFTASVDGAPLFTRVDPPAIPDFGTAHRFFTATSPFSTLTFTFRDDSGFIMLDAVSVALPEPMTLALMASGLSGLALTRRRKA